MNEACILNREEFETLQDGLCNVYVILDTISGYCFGMETSKNLPSSSQISALIKSSCAKANAVPKSILIMKTDPLVEVINAICSGMKISFSAETKKGLDPFIDEFKKSFQNFKRVQVDSIVVTGSDIVKYQDYLLIPNGASGVSVINAADPADLSLTATLPLAGTNIRDIVVNQDKLYLADTVGLKIYDISTIATPALLGSYAVNVRSIIYESNLIYIAGNQLRILDVSNPASITELDADPMLGISSYSIIKLNSTIITAHNYDGLGISQVSSNTLSFTKFLNSFCGTSGFGTNNGTTVYLNDDCGLFAWDFTDMASPISIASTISDVDNDWERQEGYVVNNVLYTNGAGAGLFSYDISNPSLITKNWNYTTYSCMNGFQILGNYIYCGGWNEGFYILDNSNPAVMPTLVGRFYQNNTTYYDAIRKVGSKVILSERGSGSAIYDVTDPVTPTFVKQLSVSGCWTIGADTQYAYVETGNTLSIVDMLDSDPSIVGSISLGDIQSILVNGNYLYVGGENNIYVIDIQDKTNPLLLQTYQYPVGYAKGLHIYNHRLFVGSDSGGYAVFSGLLGL